MKHETESRDIVRKIGVLREVHGNPALSGRWRLICFLRASNTVELVHATKLKLTGMNNSEISSQRKLVVFQVAGESFALALTCVQEIVPMAQLSRPPGLPRILEGLLNLSGTAVPVLRLDRLLDLSEARPGLYSTLLVLRAGHSPHALLVDKVSEIVSVSTKSLLPVREGQSFNGCAEAELSANGRVIHTLSPERLLLEQERKTLTEFQTTAQQRLRELQAVPG